MKKDKTSLVIIKKTIVDLSGRKTKGLFESVASPKNTQLSKTGNEQVAKRPQLQQAAENA
jgi:hypothetical protein